MKPILPSNTVVAIHHLNNHCNSYNSYNSCDPHYRRYNSIKVAFEEACKFVAFDRPLTHVYRLEIAD